MRHERGDFVSILSWNLLLDLDTRLSALRSSIGSFAGLEKPQEILLRWLKYCTELGLRAIPRLRVLQPGKSRSKTHETI